MQPKVRHISARTVRRIPGFRDRELHRGIAFVEVLGIDLQGVVLGVEERLVVEILPERVSVDEDVRAIVEGGEVERGRVALAAAGRGNREEEEHDTGPARGNQSLV